MHYRDRTKRGILWRKAFLVDEEPGIACHAGYLIRARPNRSILHPSFFFAFTQSARHRHVDLQDATFIIATIQNIGADRYADLPVPLPPLSNKSFYCKAWMNPDSEY